MQKRRLVIKPFEVIIFIFHQRVEQREARVSGELECLKFLLSLFFFVFSFLFFCARNNSRRHWSPGVVHSSLTNAIFRGVRAKRREQVKRRIQRDARPSILMPLWQGIWRSREEKSRGQDRFQVWQSTRYVHRSGQKKRIRGGSISDKWFRPSA